MPSTGTWVFIGVLVFYPIALFCLSIESTPTLKEALVRFVWGLILVALPIVIAYVLLLLLAPDLAD